MTRYEDAKHCYTVAVLLYCGEKTRAGTLGTLPMHLLTLSELMYWPMLGWLRRGCQSLQLTTCSSLDTPSNTPPPLLRRSSLLLQPEATSPRTLLTPLAAAVKTHFPHTGQPSCVEWCCCSQQHHPTHPDEAPCYRSALPL